MNIQGRKVIFSRQDIAHFRAVFPASNLRDRAYWFEFDSNGDLVDTDVPEHDDGAGAAALSQDAKNILEGDYPEWLKEISP